jgi:hypothetical protein
MYVERIAKPAQLMQSNFASSYKCFKRRVPRTPCMYMQHHDARSSTATNRRPTPANARLHAARAIIPRHRCGAPTPHPLTLAILNLDTLARLFDEALSLSYVAHCAAELAFFAFLQLLELAAGLDVFLGLLDEVLEPAFQATADVLAFVEHAVAVADALNVLNAAGEVEGRAAVLIFPLVDNPLNFFLVCSFIDVDLDIGGRLGNEERICTCGVFTSANVEIKCVFERVMGMTFTDRCRGL